MESITPNIFVRDIDLTIAFYREIGFELLARVPEEGDPVWAMMGSGSVNLMFQTFESLGEELPEIRRKDGGSLLLYIEVRNIAAFFSRIRDKVTLLKGLEKTFYGATEFSILDLNNYVLTFAEQQKQGSAETE
jgi:uncharacterized glyoxalase superfamily protein PhnB